MKKIKLQICFYFLFIFSCNSSEIEFIDLLKNIFNNYYLCLDTNQQKLINNPTVSTMEVFNKNLLEKIMFYQYNTIDSLVILECDTIIFNKANYNLFKEVINKNYKSIENKRIILSLLLCFNKYLQKDYNYIKYLDSINLNIFLKEDSLKSVYTITDTIEGIYIPKNLIDAVFYLDKFVDSQSKLDIAKLSENEFLRQEHLGLGMSIRNSWQLWIGSRLSIYFNKELKTYHPDQMSTYILQLWYRYIKNSKINLEEIETYIQTFGKFPE